MIMWFLLVVSSVRLIHWATFDPASKIGGIAKSNHSHKKQKDSLEG